MAKPKALFDKVYEVEDGDEGIWNIVFVERKTTEIAWVLSRAAADKIVMALNEIDNL